MIYYITGGARSGKSRYASNLALELSENPIYLATARRWDGEFEDRILKHESERGDNWEVIEEEKNISKLDFEQRIVVVDCVTLWLTNYFVDFKQDVEKSLSTFKSEIDQLVSRDATYIIISNEIGMGVHAETSSGRKFVDLQGWANQYIAQVADQVFFMVSGLPQKLK